MFARGDDIQVCGQEVGVTGGLGPPDSQEETVGVDGGDGDMRGTEHSGEPLLQEILELE